MKNNFTFMGVHLTEENVIMNTECIVPWNKNKNNNLKSKYSFFHKQQKCAPKMWSHNKKKKQL